MQVELAANGVKDNFYQEVPPTWDLILYVPSTIFQLCRDRSSWVEPALSLDQCVLLKDTSQWRRWGSNPRPLGLESSTLPLSHCPPLARIYKRKLRPIPPSLHTTNKCRSITGSELQVKAEHARIQRGDRGSRENHNFDRFLQKLAFGEKLDPSPTP